MSHEDTRNTVETTVRSVKEHEPLTKPNEFEEDGKPIEKSADQLGSVKQYKRRHWIDEGGAVHTDFKYKDDYHESLRHNR